MNRQRCIVWQIVTILLVTGACNLTKSFAVEPPTGTVLIEAERFADYGGWVDDSQFMDQMGSSFLLAHGLGEPVKDARTTITLAHAGTYHVWVRTRDWVATWQAPGAPGRFQLLLNDIPLETTFGTEGARWHWQDGGTRTLDTHVKVALHDLTGFDGRCDAILLVPEREPAFTPPNSRAALDALRDALSDVPHSPVDAGRYDLVVVGGGIAGTCAAISAARHDLRVALIQDRPVLGGNNSSEVRVWLQGSRNIPPFRYIGSIVAQLEQAKRAHYGPANKAELYEDDKKLDLVRAEKNIDLRLLHRANAVETDGRRITAVIAQHTRTGVRYRFRARWFADCTGDGCIGYLAGADYEMTVPGHMGRCNLWHAVETETVQPFPRCPWALDLSDKPFPGRHPPRLESLGGWYWESGFDHDPIGKSEYIRDWNLRAAFGAWDALKNTDHVFPKHRLNWVAHISGKRESRRLLGDVILTKQDLLTSRKFDDGCVPTGWKIDVHIPDPRYDAAFKGDAFIAKALFTDYRKPFWVPYRCLYSRNTENLFMAGRDISVTHEALGATRVMRTGGCMGEVVGMAASICKQYRCTPREAWTEHGDKLFALLRKPRYAVRPTRIPAELAGRVGKNLGPQATVRVSGTYQSQYDAAYVNDAVAVTTDNASRWISTAGDKSWIEYAFSAPQEVVALWLVSGYHANGRNVGPIEDAVLQYHSGTAWQDVAGSTIIGNDRASVVRQFKPVKATRFRLLITKSRENMARVWELQLFAPLK